MRHEGGSFPHPVLGLNDDFPGHSFSPNVFAVSTRQTIHVSITSLVVPNESIERMISGGQAHFVATISCRETYYRVTHRLRGPEDQVVVSADRLRGSAEVSVSVCATGPIQSYAPAGVHEDYSGATFDIEPGDALAVAAVVRVDLPTSLDPLAQPMGSFMRVTKGEFERAPFEVDYSQDRIRIALGARAWGDYLRLKQAAPAILHGALVLPVLTEAITRIDKADEDLKDFRWFVRLEQLLEPLDEALPAVQRAQQLLEAPFTRVAAVLSQLGAEEGE